VPAELLVLAHNEGVRDEVRNALGRKAERQLERGIEIAPAGPGDAAWDDVGLDAAGSRLEPVARHVETAHQIGGVDDERAGDDEAKAKAEPEQQPDRSRQHAHDALPKQR
jgi:hypothetical protein